MTPEEVEAVVMYQMNESIRRITETTNVSKAKLYTLLRSRKIAPRYAAKVQRQLSPDEMLQIARLYREGSSGERIARTLSLGRTLVYVTLHELGLYLPNNEDGTSRALTPDQEEAVVELYDQNHLTAPQIASVLDVSVTPIYRALKRAGVTRKNWSGPKKYFVRYVAPNGRLCRFQSTWEKAFAQHLDERGLDWAHESHSWLLSDGTAYTPDFWIPDWQVFVEVKGLMTEEAHRKIDLFRAAYPHLKLLVLDRKALKLYGIFQKKNLVA